LNIPLCAFAPRRTLDRHGISEPQHYQTIVSIPLATLASFLNTAEAESELCKVSGEEDELPPGVTKRPLSVSPEEALAEEDERKWNRREEMARARTDRDDRLGIV
jgi:hypothetical protein